MTSRFAACWLLLLVLGCGGGRRSPRTDAGDGVMDAAGDGAGRGRRCMAGDECDDGLDCTLDRCVVGNECRNEPLDELCPDGERCLPGRGCSQAGGCSEDAHCDDGDPCNGVETCSTSTGTCLPGAPINCDDGDPCTEDRCVPGSGSCEHSPSGRCDAGTADGGGPPPPFDPAVHYTGRFLVAPAPSLGCGMASYGFGEVRFRRSAEALQVEADWMTLEQRPPPDGPDFDVSYVHGACSVMRLRGSFSNARQFDAEWTAAMSSGCSFCPDQRQTVAGVRAD